jgi:hypothetical protein
MIDPHYITTCVHEFLGKINKTKKMLTSMEYGGELKNVTIIEFYHLKDIVFSIITFSLFTMFWKITRIEA